MNLEKPDSERSNLYPDSPPVTEESLTFEQVREHLLRCDRTFQPELSRRVNIDCYSRKLRTQARLAAYVSDGAVEALLAFYSSSERMFVSSISVVPGRSRSGLGSSLLEWLKAAAVAEMVPEIRLEVSPTHSSAVAFYHAQGFEAYVLSSNCLVMQFLIPHDELNGRRRPDA
jgi:ribosomal protein S18 acetylase RimI-like enzyme